MSAPISGLVGGTVYHYRITATNANGTSNGADQTFYVPVPTPVPQPALPFRTGPTTNPFTYCCYDLVTSKYLGRLPLRGVTFSSQILTPGSFSGTIDISSPAVQNLGPLGITQPARTALLIDYLGSFIWGGVIWPRSYKFDATSRQLQVGATELWSYPAGRTQATDYSAPPFSGITGNGNGSYMPIWDATGTSVPEGGPGTYDPLLIAWQILSDLLYLVPSGNILGMGIAANGFTTPAAYLASGTNTLVAEYLSVNYPYNSIQQAGMIVNQLATNGYLSGFDYAVDVAGSAGGVPVATLNLSYPRRGRLYSQNHLVLDCMRALSYEFPEDGTQTANTVYEQGMSGSLSVSQNAQPLDGGYPVLEQIKSRANITSANVLPVLQGMGASDLEQLSYPVCTPSVTTDLYTGPITLGSFVVGDDARVRIPATDGKGGMFDPRFPTGLDEEWRISGYQATVADDGQSTLQFQLAVPPSLALPAGPPVPSGG